MNRSNVAAVTPEGLLRAFEPPTVRHPTFEELKRAPGVRNGAKQHPLWYDVDATREPAEVRLAIEAIDLSPATVAPLLDHDSRPEPHKAARCPIGGCFVYWAFSASYSADSDLLCNVELQPLTVLVGEGFVLTARHAGDRFTVGSLDTRRGTAVARGSPIGIERLTAEAETHWLAADSPDRDVLFFSILQACVTTLFAVRAELGMKKIAYDNEYFRGVLDARKTAATIDLTIHDVNARAQLDGRLTEEARLRLLSIQHVAAVMRLWFDDLKPPGRADSGIWLPDTERHSEAQHLIERIYQVRNDLRRVRTEANESMALLMSADTGGQLMAVRALLDRTEAARNAAVVAAAITVILAAVALAATLAAIPSGGTRYSPVGTAAGLAGLVILGSVVVSAAVAFLSKYASPANRVTRSLRTVAVVALTLGLVAFFMAYTKAIQPQSLGVWAGVGLALLALLLFAYTSDFGESRRGRGSAGGDVSSRASTDALSRAD